MIGPPIPGAPWMALRRPMRNASPQGKLVVPGGGGGSGGGTPSTSSAGLPFIERVRRRTGETDSNFYERLRRHTEKVQILLNSLIAKGFIVQTDLNEFEIDPTP